MGSYVWCSPTCSLSHKLTSSHKPTNSLVHRPICSIAHKPKSPQAYKLLCSLAYKPVRLQAYKLLILASPTFSEQYSQMVEEPPSTFFSEVFFPSSVSNPLNPLDPLDPWNPSDPMTVPRASKQQDEFFRQVLIFPILRFFKLLCPQALTTYFNI